MTTLQLRQAAANGDGWATEQLIKKLKKDQKIALQYSNYKRTRNQGQGRVIPYKGRDAFFACARAF